MSAIPMPIDEPLNVSGPVVIEEMIKIISLLDDHSGNEQMRRALRFYKTPVMNGGGDWGWLLKGLKHFECPQDPMELQQMLSLIAGNRRLLEVGSSFGGTLRRMAAVLAPDALVVSVDWPIDDTPKYLHPIDSLKNACHRISLTGRHVELFVADSHDEETVRGVNKFAPFDFGFIDGDHSYEGVKADWLNYGQMCKVVGLHDIAGPVEGCTRLWTEIKEAGHKTTEFVTPGKGFGIGIVFREGG